MKAFAQPTNVDMSNRLICFNINRLGEQLKPVAMISMLEFINTAVMNSNRKDATAATWVYFDEIYLLLRDEEVQSFCTRAGSDSANITPMPPALPRTRRIA